MMNSFYFSKVTAIANPREADTRIAKNRGTTLECPLESMKASGTNPTF
jgi:hypothetical protein